MSTGIFLHVYSTDVGNTCNLMIRVRYRCLAIINVWREGRGSGGVNPLYPLPENSVRCYSALITIMYSLNLLKLIYRVKELY